MRSRRRHIVGLRHSPAEVDGRDGPGSERRRACTSPLRAARPRAPPGNAGDLPFPEACFDVVPNVESCHCYPDVPRFLKRYTEFFGPEASC
jgi:hypothetical protein